MITETKAIRFEGNGYSDEWKVEAKKRGLPNLTTTPEALSVFENDKAMAFMSKQKVLSPDEIKARYNIMLERYIKQIEMEAATLIELSETKILPVVEKEVERIAMMVSAVKNAGKQVSLDRLESIKSLYEDLLKAKATLETEFDSVLKVHHESERAKLLSTKVIPAMMKVREYSDEAEGRIADEAWILPKYREMLFMK